MSAFRTAAVAAVAAAALSIPVAASALTPQTDANLHAAASQEAFDWTTYTLFAEQAAREGGTSAAAALGQSATTERRDHLVALTNQYGAVGGIEATCSPASTARSTRRP